jgi:3-oxoacyl-[acyl-carrier protein] reductase
LPPHSARSGGVVTPPLAGKVAIVIGGSKGIGRAASLRLAEEGADVIVGARGPEAAAEVVSEIEGMGRRAVFLPVNLTEWESVKGMLDEAVRQFGQLDVLVASGAGGGSPARPFVEIDPLTYPAYFQARVLGRLYPIGAAVPFMRGRGYGKIVVVTTDAGRVPTPAESLIGGAAASVIFMIRALGRELARFGIRVNGVSTTLTRDTPSYERFTRRESGEVLGKAFKKIEERAPFGLNEPRDVAEAIAFYASPRSDQITGTTLSVNGGISFPG